MLKRMHTLCLLGKGIIYINDVCAGGSVGHEIKWKLPINCAWNPPTLTPPTAIAQTDATFATIVLTLLCLKFVGTMQC